MFTFTHEQLEQFLLSVITSFAGEDGVYDFSYIKDNTRQMVVNRAIAMLETNQPHRDTLAENSLPAIDEDSGMTPGWFDEDEIFSDALKSDPPIFCPDCGDELSSIETGDKIWCMRCGYTSNNSLVNEIYHHLCDNHHPEALTDDFCQQLWKQAEKEAASTSETFDDWLVEALNRDIEPKQVDSNDNISPAALGLTPAA